VKVFLSYDLSSQQIADLIRTKIEESGAHQVLSDESIQLGEHIPRAIVQMLDEADAFVLLVSQESRNKEWLVWEWRTVLERSWTKPGKPIVGIVIGNAEPPPFLQGRKFIRISDPSEQEEGIEKILNLLERHEPGTVEDVKTRLRQRMEEVSGEISKFKLTPDDLEKQQHWLEEKIDRISKIDPDSIDLANLQFKLGDTLKALGKTPEVVSVFQKGLEILERNNGVPLRTRAKIQTKLARALRDIGDNEGAVRQVCNALETCGIRTDTNQVHDQLQLCEAEVPILTEMLSEMIAGVSHDIALRGRELLETMAPPVPSDPKADAKQVKGGMS